MDLKKVNFSTVVKKFELSPNTLDFIGHAVALYTNDDYLDRPAIETLDKIRLYMDSIGRYGDSPFIYPVYGLGGIPEGFSRMCAIFGGTFMLNKDIDKVLFDEEGKVCGVQSGTEIAKTKMLICNPTYMINSGLNQKVKSIGKVIRCICIMDHPIPGTKDLPSVQVIIPQKQTGRKSGNT
jgi:Rab GDP dissociation inhibitor